MNSIFSFLQKIRPEDVPNMVLNFILKPEFSGPLFYIRIAFILITVIFAAIIILLLTKTTWLKKRYLENFTEIMASRPYGAKTAFKQWVKITARLDKKDEAEYKLAVIEADALLDDILKGMGHEGDTMSEKLKKVKEEEIPNLDEVWMAHKIRNSVVHDPEYKLDYDETKRAIKAYEQALRDLEMF
jgi:hypothetical protein